MIIGEQTREIKARVINYEFNLTSNIGHINIQYYYEVTSGEGDDAVIRKVPVHTFSYEIDEDPMSSSKKDYLMTLATQANPLP